KEPAMATEPHSLLKPIAEAKVVTPSRSFPRAIIAELRPHQWTKNALVLLPMMLAPGMPTLPMIFQGVLAAGAFSLCASAGYVLNDLLDIEADRAHPTKCARPFASGDLPTAFGPFL